MSTIKVDTISNLIESAVIDVSDIATSTEFGASSGASLVGYLPAGTGAVATDVQTKLRESVSVLDFYANGVSGVRVDPTGVIDSTLGIQAAIDSVCDIATGDLAGSVYFPRGIYKITSTLNLTSNRSTGLRRDGLTLIGEGMSSRIDGACGSGKAIVETTGSQWLRIDGVWLNTLTVTNPATIGILSAVGTVLPQTQNQHIEDTYVFMHTDPTANAGLGTIALYNYGAEENTYDSVYLNADVATVLTSSNDGNQPGPVTLTSYQTLSTSHSLGMTTFTGECFLVAVSFNKAPLIIQNITATVFENTYISATGSGSDQYGIWFAGNAVGLKFNGVIEGKSTIFAQGAIINSDLNITYGGVTAGSAPAIVVDRSNAFGTISNSTIKISLQANGTRPILSTSDGNENATSLYSINNTDVYAQSVSGAPTLYIPANVAGNANSYNIGVYGGSTRPTTSAFATGLSVGQSNVTGDGTVYDVHSTAWTAEYDQAAALSANGVFTAQLNGIYKFTAELQLTNIAAGQTDAEMKLVVGSKQYVMDRFNPVAVSGGIGFITMKGVVDVPLTVGETAKISVYVGGGALSVNITSGAASNNWATRFSGVKVA